MKTTIDKEFFEKWKNKDVVMWCKKKEYAEEFCRLMDENKLKWATKESYLGDSCWSNYERQTCYSFNSGGFYRKEWYIKNDYMILDFEDYIIKENAKSKTYVLTEYYNNGGDWEDRHEHETILKAFENLNDALKYKGKNFKIGINDGFYKEDFIYVSEDEDLGEEDYLNYRIYEVELQE